jgi:hypothetical protein
MFEKRCLTVASVLIGLTVVQASALAAPPGTAQIPPGANRPPRPGVKFLDQPPAGFDAPVYRNNLIETKYSEMKGRDGSPSQTAISKTKDAPATVYQWLQTALQSSGWELEAAKPLSQPNALQEKGNLFMGKAHKQNESLVFYCVRRGGDSTTLNISVIKTPSGGQTK